MLAQKNGYIHCHVHIQPQTEDTSDSDSLPDVSITISLLYSSPFPHIPPSPPKKYHSDYQHKNNIIYSCLCVYPTDYKTHKVINSLFHNQSAES